MGLFLLWKFIESFMSFVLLGLFFNLDRNVKLNESEFIIFSNCKLLCKFLAYSRHVYTIFGWKRQMTNHKYLIDKSFPNFQRYTQESPILYSGKSYFTETCAQVTLSKGLVHKDPKNFCLFFILQQLSQMFFFFKLTLALIDCYHFWVNSSNW